jgi:hypothetical protein
MSRKTPEQAIADASRATPPIRIYLETEGRLCEDVFHADDAESRYLEIVAEAERLTAADLLPRSVRAPQLRKRHDITPDLGELEAFPVMAEDGSEEPADDGDRWDGLGRGLRACTIARHVRKLHLSCA